MKLAEIYLITGEFTAQDGLLMNVERCLQRGIRLIQFRAKSLDKATYYQYAKEIYKLTRKYQAKLLLNPNSDDFSGECTDGWHLTAAKLMLLKTRPVAKNFLLAASCHNQNELLQAQKIGVDFVTLSPVQATRSHPEAIPLGWENFRRLTESINMPIFALGGMSVQDLSAAKKNGAYGIAMISDLWKRKLD